MWRTGTSDCFVEVPDEVAAAMAELDRKEAAYRLRTYLHKAYYSLDRDDGIEHAALFVSVSPDELYERKVTMQEFHAAKENYGMGIAEYIRDLRMEKARQLLLEQPDLPLTEIASMCGFPDYNYFITVFRKKEGIPSKGNFSRKPVNGFPIQSRRPKRPIFSEKRKRK